MAGKTRRPQPASRFPSFWPLLACLFTTTLALSLHWFHPAGRLALFLAGILLPLWLLGRTGDPGVSRPAAPPLWRNEFLGPLPGALLVAILMLGFALRFYRIDSLFLWPTGDEGLIASEALGLSRDWDWRFFYTVGQNPPAFVWLCTFFWKLFPGPFWNLWAPAALVSCLTLAVGHVALREFTSRSFAWCFTALIAFSFWPLYLGRRCLPAVLPPLGEFLLLWCLAKFLKAPRERKLPWAFLLGACAGLQSLTYVSWPVVFLAAAGIFLLALKSLPRERPGAFGLFCLGAFLGLAPFLMAFWREGYGQHILSLGQHTDWFRYGGFLERVHRYGEAFLFRLPGEGGELGAAGGLLNPVLGTFFLLGLAELWRLRATPVAWGLGALLVFFSLPGILSLNLQTFRVVPELPLLLVLVVLGLRPLAERIPRRRLGILLALLLACSAVFDFARLAAPYSLAQREPDRLAWQGKSSARYRAFLEWEKASQGMGPGLVLCEWDLWADRTLDLAVHPFNACRNPRLGKGQARWLGILADARYEPYLRQAFPGTKWSLLEKDLSGANFLLGILEMGEKERARAMKWARADGAFHRLNRAVDRVLDRDVIERLDREIREDYPAVAGDPLLESIYWEKVAEFYYYHGGRMRENLRALELALERGVPAPHLKAKLSGLRSLLQGPGSTGAEGASPRSR